MSSYRGKPRKYSEELFVTVQIPNVDWAKYYSVKVTGVSFNTNKNPQMKRRDIVKRFLSLHEAKIFIPPNEDSKKFITNSLLVGDIWKREKELTSCIRLVLEPNNKFDSNAICVQVNIEDLSSEVSVFYDVGYIPKDHSRILKKDYKQYFLIGARKDGVGLRLEMILCKKRILIREPVNKSNNEDEIILPKFLSLKQARRVLEV